MNRWHVRIDLGNTSIILPPLPEEDAYKLMAALETAYAGQSDVVVGLLEES